MKYIASDFVVVVVVVVVTKGYKLDSSLKRGYHVTWISTVLITVL